MAKSKSKERVVYQIWGETDDMILDAQAKYESKTGVSLSKVNLMHKLIKIGTEQWDALK